MKVKVALQPSEKSDESKRCACALFHSLMLMLLFKSIKRINNLCVFFFFFLSFVLFNLMKTFISKMKPHSIRLPQTRFGIQYPAPIAVPSNVLLVCLNWPWVAVEPCAKYQIIVLIIHQMKIIAPENCHYPNNLLRFEMYKSKEIRTKKATQLVFVEYVTFATFKL